ncbi:MAG: hypothetical protein ACTSXD_05150 [Candidatus Heimdallarchaeaceae archaeon]
MAKKISFKKKILKYSSSSHLIIIEKPLIEFIKVKAGDVVKVTIERLNDKKEKRRLAIGELTEHLKPGEKVLIKDKGSDEYEKAEESNSNK